MEHCMKLHETNFEAIKQGKKIREYRLLDDKRKKIRVGDTIKFLKLPSLKEEIVVDVKNIEIFPNWYECYSAYFKEDFQFTYANVNAVVQDTYQHYYSKEESSSNSCVVFTIKKHRIPHFDNTACYLKKDNKVLMIHFFKKWGQVYAPPGGKFEAGEAPFDCMIREFYEETGLTLISPKLQGISYYNSGSAEGINFIYVAENFEGMLTPFSEEGSLEWISIKDLSRINQFEQNKLFTPYLFKDTLFEGKFFIDETCSVLQYEIR